MLPRNQTQPGRQLTTTGEVPRIAYGCDQCAGGNRADSGDCCQLAAQLVIPVPSLNLGTNFSGLTIQFLQMRQQPLYEHTKRVSVSARFDGEAIKVNDGDGASRGKRPGDGHHGC